MAETRTPQQELAVKNRGGRLLVSAAAGSGKTKVLVDRLMDDLTDPVQPANLDDFLMITYTRAAAAELRGKIGSKLSELSAAQPENRALQEQLQRLYLAKISTVHGFCADLLREYAYQLDIPADFRVADENECQELREEAAAQVLEQAYSHAGEDPAFCAFVDTQGLGRDDRLVPEIVMKVYDSARCHLDPEGWLESCAERMETGAFTGAEQTVWGAYLMEDLFSYLEQQIMAMKACRDAARDSGLDKAAALLGDTVFQLECLRSSRTWDEVVQRRTIDYGRLTFPRKNPDPELTERIKAVREGCKKGLERKLRSFSGMSEQVLSDLNRTGTAVQGLLGLVRQFGDRYDRLKHSRRVLDFGDLEQRTLDLLLGRHRTGPTQAAAEIGSRFREVLVDEYQDSNAVQDAIFMTLTRTRQNAFLVGDVKQSIYRFRLADPTIFLEKYNTYVPAETAEPGQGRKILLSSNFRSGGAVLSAVNDVFRLCMTPAVGELAYTEAESLREGLPHVPLGEPEVELHVCSSREPAAQTEAAFVADRIRELLSGNHMVRQGETIRPIVPEDIVILLRSPGSVGYAYQEALTARGIRCTSGGGDNLFTTAEVSTLRSLLQVIGNPRQDIPLLSALASPVFGFTADELAQLRANCRTGCLYDALLAGTSEKAVSFCQILKRLRRDAQMKNLPELMEEIFLLTRMDSIYAAMPGGAGRVENLRTFCRLASEFAATGRRELGQFLEHLDALEARGLIAQGEQSSPGCVTILSIHKSKGLEFPVVFLCGLAREFNREEQRQMVLCDGELGLGLSAVEEKARLRYPTIAKRAIAVKSAGQSLSEELRVLYVAMTRAKDRLILTYTEKNPENTLRRISSRLDLGGRELLTRDAVCLGDWVLLAAMHRPEAGALFAIGGRPAVTVSSDSPWLIAFHESAPEEQASAPVEIVAEAPRMPAEAAEEIGKALSFQYPYMAATRTPSKQTATGLKGREKDQEAAENTPGAAPAARAWRMPFRSDCRSRGKDRGNAVHRVLQYLRYDACNGEQAVTAELERLVSEQYLTAEEAALVDCGRIARFFETELGRRLRGGGQVLREFKFSILDDGERYGEHLQGEQVLLQGVVDCALIEADGITLVDFKTDRIGADGVPAAANRYRSQVLAYQRAMERIWERKVKRACLYFFYPETFADIPLE